MVDQEKRGLVQGTDLAVSLNALISATRMICGGAFLRQLLPIKLEFSSTTNDTGYEDGPSEREFLTSLTLEEVLLTYFIELSSDDAINHVRLQMKNLQGVANMFTGNIAEAEKDLKFALHILGALKLESELMACKYIC